MRPPLHPPTCELGLSVGLFCVVAGCVLGGGGGIVCICHEVHHLDSPQRVYGCIMVLVLRRSGCVGQGGGYRTTSWFLLFHQLAKCYLQAEIIKKNIISSTLNNGPNLGLGVVFLLKTILFKQVGLNTTPSLYSPSPCLSVGFTTGIGLHCRYGCYDLV